MDVMHCPKCQSRLPWKFAWATGFKPLTCGSCKTVITPTEDSLKKVSYKCSKYGALVGSVSAGIAVYYGMASGAWIFPIALVVTTIIGVTSSSYYYAKNNLLFERWKG